MKPPAHLRSRRRRAGGQRWDEHNSTRQAQILEAAVALIEQNDPNVEVSIQQIAERAGLARSVVYRQFDNREDLDSRVREFILERYVAEVEKVLVLDPAKTLEDIILDVMRTVVRWAAEHPKLYQYGQSGTVHGHAAGETSLTIGRHRVAETLWQQVSSWSGVLGIDVLPYRPVVYGIVGLVEGMVTEYIGTPADSERPDQEAIARLLASSVWHLYAGHAADRGYQFDRSATMGDSLAKLLADAAAQRD
ncbi:TetR/AcrR family transcriptional regulator [Nocardia iowensis]|uniref:TetR/AcrR family transcriptional regulator n=1 Tax=Nocardia iowensis TaxID=204891 RepID=A0ABX8RRU9_NOCIO|nr:TetR/AcrR family transcriptional regulator [Nocardia iowensis]QXN91155.1 TetR/AcrR family transcriptional regulator [Nocardia iowensis]